MQKPLDQIPMRVLDHPERSAHLRKADDGTQYLSCGIPYDPIFESPVDYLERAVKLRPDTTFLAQREEFGAGHGIWDMGLPGTEDLFQIPIAVRSTYSAAKPKTIGFAHRSFEKYSLNSF